MIQASYDNRHVMPMGSGYASRCVFRPTKCGSGPGRPRLVAVKLYLLDLNDPENPPIVRGITNELYGDGVEMRIAEEVVLGIDGWRLLSGWD